MNCETVRELLLEADLARLGGPGDTPLALHLRACASCSAFAELLNASQTALRTDARPRRDADAVADAVLRQARGVTSASRRGRWVRWALAAPAAAAAMVMLLLTRPGAGPPVQPDVRVTIAGTPAAPVVEIPTGRSAAIFTTEDPLITVVWLYEEGVR
jgi:hypothetical protein